MKPQASHFQEEGEKDHSEKTGERKAAPEATARSSDPKLRCSESLPKGVAALFLTISRKEKIFPKYFP